MRLTWSFCEADKRLCLFLCAYFASIISEKIACPCRPCRTRQHEACGSQEGVARACGCREDEDVGSRELVGLFRLLDHSRQLDLSSAMLKERAGIVTQVGWSGLSCLPLPACGRCNIVRHPLHFHMRVAVRQSAVRPLSRATVSLAAGNPQVAGRLLAQLARVCDRGVSACKTGCGDTEGMRGCTVEEGEQFSEGKQWRCGDSRVGQLRCHEAA